MGRDRFTYYSKKDRNNRPENINDVRRDLSGYRSAFKSRNRRGDSDYPECMSNTPKRSDSSASNAKPDRRDDRRPLGNKRRTFGFDDDVRRPECMTGTEEDLRETNDGNMDDRREEITHVEEYEYMEDFLDAYLRDDVKTSFGKQKELIYEHIINLGAIISNYFNPKYRDILPEMELVMQVMVTDIFSRAFYNVLVDCIREGNDPEGLFANWDEDYSVVGMMVSILIGTRRQDMTEETETLYMTKIAKGIWNEEIRQLTQNAHITEELATDLILRTPIDPQQMKDYHIEAFYPGFLESILLHAEDNIEVLDRATQGKIFRFIYGKGKNAAKVVGRNLSDPEKDGLESMEKMVYTEFKTMLYETLNTFDIGIIKFVLKFIVGRKKDNPSVKLVFDFDTAVEYPNINKALQSYIAEDRDAKDCLNL